MPKSPHSRKYQRLLKALRSSQKNARRELSSNRRALFHFPRCRGPRPLSRSESSGEPLWFLNALRFHRRWETTAPFPCQYRHSGRRMVRLGILAPSFRKTSHGRPPTIKLHTNRLLSRPRLDRAGRSLGITSIPPKRRTPVTSTTVCARHPALANPEFQAFFP